MFLQAAEMSGMKAQFDLPGFTATIMAPSDAAFSTFLNGIVSQYAKLAILKGLVLLAQLLSILLSQPQPPPVPLGPGFIPASASCLCHFFLPRPIYLVSELFTKAISGMWHASTPAASRTGHYMQAA